MGQNRYVIAVEMRLSIAIESIENGYYRRGTGDRIHFHFSQNSDFTKLILQSNAIFNYSEQNNSITTLDRLTKEFNPGAVNVNCTNFQSLELRAILKGLENSIEDV